MNRPRQARQLPLNLGHRGARGLAPENTLAGFRAGMAAGVDGFEFDVQRTTDGHLVVLHDEELERITGVSGRCVEWSLAQLQELDAGSHFDIHFAGEPIPTLEQVLELVPATYFLNIEAKRTAEPSDGLENALVETIRRHNLYDRCLVSSFNGGLLARIGSADPRIPLGLLFDPRLPFDPGDAWPANRPPLTAWHPYHLVITADLVQEARSRGLQVNTWTVNDIQAMQRMLDLGVDAIITDWPDRLSALLDGEADS